MSLARARLLRTYGGITPFTVPDMTEPQIFGYAQQAEQVRKEEMEFLADSIVIKIMQLFSKK